MRQGDCVGISRVVLLAGAALVVTGSASCTHTMTVKNLHQYAKEASAPRKLIVALEDGATTDDDQNYFKFVHEALATHHAVSQVVVAAAGDPAEAGSDVIAVVHPHAQYNGSGWNYLITFPGFIVFTHAWNGFVYSADIVTAIDVRTPHDGTATHTEITTKYNMRYCDFPRGAATSSGWYTPGWGGVNLFLGFYMVGYDTDATPEFEKEVRTAYGEFIANSIVESATQRLTAGASSRSSVTCANFDPLRRAFAIGCGA